MRIGEDCCAFHLLNVILFGPPNWGTSLTNPRYNIDTSVPAKPRWSMSTFGSAETSPPGRDEASLESRAERKQEQKKKKNEIKKETSHYPHPS